MGKDSERISKMATDAGVWEEMWVWGLLVRAGVNRYCINLLVFSTVILLFFPRVFLFLTNIICF